MNSNRIGQMVLCGGDFWVTPINLVYSKNTMPMNDIKFHLILQ